MNLLSLVIVLLNLIINLAGAGRSTTGLPNLVSSLNLDLARALLLVAGAAVVLATALR